MAISHRCEDDPRFVLQVDVRAITFLQDSFMEVVSVVNVQVPAPHFRYTHIMAAQFRGLDIPDDILTVGILVANFDDSGGHSVDSLTIDIQAIPGVSKLNDGISLEGLLEKYSLDGDLEVDEV